MRRDAQRPALCALDTPKNKAYLREWRKHYPDAPIDYKYPTSPSAPPSAAADAFRAGCMDCAKRILCPDWDST